MSEEVKIQRLHNVYTSATYQKAKESPHAELLNKPHLALFINGDWLPILPGMIIGLMRNIEHVDGIAPYIFRKLDASPGKEFIDLVAWTTDRTSGRKLQFLANYSGVYRSGVQQGNEQAVEKIEK